MATIDERIAALEEAISQGARRVMMQTPAGRQEVEYHSMKEMRDALASLKAEKAGAAGRSNIILASF